MAPLEHVECVVGEELAEPAANAAAIAPPAE
jgi:hypothetical protein